MDPKKEEATSIITLVGAKMATKGLQFTFLGTAKECKDCKLFQVCGTNLEPNRLYEITEVRGVEHKCPVHEGGVKTVVVTEPPQKLVIKSRFAIEGVILTFQPPGVDCPNYACEYWDHCNNGFVRTGDRVRIIEKLQSIPCSTGKQISLVLASRVQ